MPTAPPEVPRIGPGVPYADGSEDRLLSILGAASDRSSGSDELAAAIVDWPTLYHLSHQRAHLFRPLQITPGMRVLDAGAGTGTAARALGERGARVTALEGSYARAQAAALRCADLAEVEVLCGALDDLDDDRAGDGFDLVLLIGVVEYAGADLGGGGGAPAMLSRARELLAPGGSVVVAIENQLGLKYLLGAAEDHRGRAWVGIDDYPGPPGVRTWTRAELAGMLTAAGLPHQRWMAPFPDYKLPTTILDESIYEEPDVATLVGQLLATPVKPEDHEPVRNADAAAAHGVFLRGRIGLDVASSFLVVAGVGPDDAGGVVEPGVLAWLLGGRRRQPWRRERALTADRRLVPLGTPRPAGERWLSRPADTPRPYVAGSTLGEAVTAAIHSHDLGALGEVLRRWDAELVARSLPTASEVDGDARPEHPFLPGWSERCLPDGWLDVNPANFVATHEGLVMIDDEWRTGGPVDLDLVRLRALWVMANDLVTSGVEHPWGDEAPVGSIVAALAGLAGVEVDPRSMGALRDAEVDFAQLVTGHGATDLSRSWLNEGLRSIDLRADRRLESELTAHRHRVAELEARLAHLEAERARLASARGAARHQLARIGPLRAVARRVRRAP